MCLRSLKMGRIVDLSHELHPGDESSELYIKTHFVEEIFPRYMRGKDQWYIIQRVSFLDHIGTHVESPLHYVKNGRDVSEIPLDQLIGETVIFDFTHKKPNEEIGIDDFVVSGKEIKQGDMVFINTGQGNYTSLRTEYQHPYLSSEAVKWLVAKGISCLGIDSSGIENKRTSSNAQPNHQILFTNAIPLIEQLTNLDKLKTDRVLVFVLPLKIRGLDACPVRVVAIEQPSLPDKNLGA